MNENPALIDYSSEGPRSITAPEISQTPLLQPCSDIRNNATEQEGLWFFGDVVLCWRHSRQSSRCEFMLFTHLSPEDHNKLAAGPLEVIRKDATTVKWHEAPEDIVF